MCYNYLGGNMSSKSEYNKIENKIEKVNQEIDKLMKDEYVQKYVSLKDDLDQLLDLKDELYVEMKTDEYSSCNHIFVYTKIKHETVDNYEYKCCGCIKCGLNNEVLDYKRKDLNPDQLIMYNYLSNKNNSYGGSLNAHVLCNLDYARAIYRRIAEKHPGIDDKTALKYFEIALDNMNNIKVSDERKESRAKRLALNIKNIK